jgi:hypothetical protein
MLNLSRSFSVAALVAASSFISACGDHDVKVNGASVEHASFAKRDSARTLGPGDIRIATTDSAVEIALIGDSLVAGLGAATRSKIKAKTDTNAVTGTGIGASFEKMIKSTVAGALDHELEIPISEISRVDYEDGHLVFYDKKGGRMNVMTSDGDRGRQSRFSESDAKDFIAAFKSKTTRV